MKLIPLISLTFGKLKKKMDLIFSEFIRLRDRGKPCVSCGKVKPLEDGHFIPRAYMRFRWDEKNNHGQCQYCNWTLEGNRDEYRKEMIKRYGKEFVEMLERDKRKTMKYCKGDLIILIQHYQEKVDTLKSQL